MLVRPRIERGHAISEGGDGIRPQDLPALRDAGDSEAVRAVGEIVPLDCYASYRHIAPEGHGHADCPVGVGGGYRPGVTWVVAADSGIAQILVRVPIIATRAVHRTRIHEPLRFPLRREADHSSRYSGVGGIVSLNACTAGRDLHSREHESHVVGHRIVIHGVVGEGYGARVVDAEGVSYPGGPVRGVVVFQLWVDRGAVVMHGCVREAGPQRRARRGIELDHAEAPHVGAVDFVGHGVGGSVVVTRL